MTTTHRHARLAGPAILCTLTFLLTAALANHAAAFTIRGTVVNGTTGEKNVAATVQLVNPSAGMAPVQEVQAAGGTFTMSGVDASAPLYIVRVDYQGVLYMQMVQPAGDGDVDVSIPIYETTTSWEGVHVVVPHVAASAHEDHLEIETMYEIHNHAEPARTIEGTDAQFLVYIPEDKIEITRSFVTFNEVPIDRFPVPTDEPGVYRIDYPIRPGETSIGISYSVPYTGRLYTLGYKLMTDIEKMTVYAVNPGMAVTSSTLNLGLGESVHDMTAYELSTLAKGSQIQLTFAGGQAISEPVGGGGTGSATSGSGGTSVVVLPPSAEGTSFLLMVIVLLALVAFVGIAAHGTVNPLDQAGQVRAYYDLLLKRMAKLDDLSGADMIPSDVYAAKRAELKTQLAALRYRLHAEKGGKGKKPGAHGHAAKVAGNERTSAS